MAELDMIFHMSQSTIYDLVRAYFLLLWAMVWPLAFGFLLSAWVRTRVPDRIIMEHMGRNTLLGAVASFLFGAVSSVCNYAVVGMARTLRMKGATWPNTLTYMTASTDIGITMLIAIYGLLGASFLGLELATSLMFIFFGYAFAIKMLPSVVHTGGQTDFPKNGASQDSPSKNSLEPDSLGQNPIALTGHAMWRQTAVHFYDDIVMTRRDILVGMGIASALGVLVPSSWWEMLFLHHAENPLFIWIWNSLVGILIAVLSFGCSIGNVSLAAVLWWNGISVSGVMSFILASLLTFPMLSMYKKDYGLASTKRLVAVNVLGIVCASIVMELFLWCTNTPLDRVTSASTGGELGHIARFALNIVFGALGLLAFCVGRKHSSMASMDMSGMGGDMNGDTRDMAGNIDDDMGHERTP